MVWRLKSCGRCRGDLVVEEFDWRCFQCGRYYYPHKPIVMGPSLEINSSAPTLRSPAPAKPKGLRNVNSIIQARASSDQRWWARNKEIIACLEEGKTVREIAMLVGCNLRRVRNVRQMLLEISLEGDIEWASRAGQES